MLEENTGMINDDDGKITNDGSVEDTASGRRKRSRERGKDTKPRNFPLHTLKNLPQFRNKSHEEVRQYILEKKGVDIGSNFRLANAAVWILIILVVVAGGIGIWKICQRYQNREEIENGEIVDRK